MVAIAMPARIAMATSNKSIAVAARISLRMIRW
jgi:hypothetical protein